MSAPDFDASPDLASRWCDDFRVDAERAGIDAALARLADRLGDAGRHHERFDLRLLEARRRLGLPEILATPLDELPESVREAMQTAYVSACKEAGAALLAAARPREAWLYLRLAVDKPEAAELFRAVADTEENAEQLIEVCLHEGVDPVRGFELVLRHHGMCNAISLYDAEMHGRPRPERRRAADLLVRALRADLHATLRREIAAREGAEPPADASMAELLRDRESLFADGNYHVDVSHLGSVVRLALACDDPPVLLDAIDLCLYGERLSPQFQYPGEPPFTDRYPAHRAFFQTLLDRGGPGLELFRHRATEFPPETHGAGPFEVHVALLARTGRAAEALETLLRKPPEVRSIGFAPTLWELTEASGRYDLLVAASHQRGDIVAFAAGVARLSRTGLPDAAAR